MVITNPNIFYAWRNCRRDGFKIHIFLICQFKSVACIKKSSYKQIKRVTRSLIGKRRSSKPLLSFKSGRGASKTFIIKAKCYVSKLML